MTVDDDLDRVFGPDPDPKGHRGPVITTTCGWPRLCEVHAHDWVTGVLSGVPYWECVTCRVMTAEAPAPIIPPGG